ncbi:Hypothetical Protein RradSPS_1795 [Rubrobacter radiotolerans]|uniref:Uncharacterized protein n=1 Tax=Rubrobacter radiotolerans TaxID=42256 RepID=A0A023X429_RUBRA|nr:Hypothetical Protein RradSPS_1795 [Rubrobacter radiotolerans]SMC06099.1 hypothetical protein SAMN00767673_1797 [Rubrobacter radiotolerans DSM 5868]
MRSGVQRGQNRRSFGELREDTGEGFQIYRVESY